MLAERVDASSGRAIVARDEGAYLGIYIAGVAGEGTGGRDYLTIKYEDSDTTLPVQSWAQIWDGPLSLDDVAKGITLQPNGLLYVAGWSALYTQDYLVLEYDPETGVLLDAFRYDDGSQEALESLGCFSVPGYPVIR